MIFDPDDHFSPEAAQARPGNAFKPFGTGQRSCNGAVSTVAQKPQPEVTVQPVPAAGSLLVLYGSNMGTSEELAQRIAEDGQANEKDGVTKLYTAFSRLDPQKKVYVQDKIYEHKDEVWQQLQDGAIVYICGDTSRMAPDVRRTFACIYQEKTGKSEQEANQWLDDLTVKNRYMVDIWGI